MFIEKRSGFALLALALCACGGDDKKAVAPTGATQCPPGQYFDGQFCQNMQAAPGAQPTAAPTAPGATPGVPTAAPPVPIATAAAGPTATPLDPAAAAAATQALNLLAQQSAPGAKAIGSPIAGQFQQGQSLEGQVQMQANKCYTVVGAGLPPVANLDIQLAYLSPMPGLPSPVVAQDQTVGSNAIIGEKTACYRSLLPAPMKVIVTVSQGSGVAAAQVYEK
ncbi:MAG TPA: hypothetical protein VGK73_38015 [Polyangiaceae bacterium]